MEPRCLACIAVIAKSFARIHEINLKKHGVLPLRFVNGADHGRLRPGDRLRITGLTSLRPGEMVHIEVKAPDGNSWTLRCDHGLQTNKSIGFMLDRRSIRLQGADWPHGKGAT